MKLSMVIYFLLCSLFCSAQNCYLFAGTYTGSGSKGIYVYNFNSQTGKATWVSNTDSVINPSFLIVSPGENYVYAVNETHGSNPGKVSSFSFDKENGSLKFLNSELTGGDDPCHLTLSNDGKWLFVANYSSGNASAFPVNNDGSLQPYIQLLQDSGTGANKARQEKAHVHETVFSPDYNYLFTPDLGTDKIMIYKFNSSSKQPLSPSSNKYTSVTSGSGPRHLTFYPNKKYAYLINELTGDVVAFNYNDGKLREIQKILAHPKNFKGVIGSAEIIISPDGKFLYASNRGDENNLAIFSIDAATGKLTLKDYQPTLGKAPRSFVIDPTGDYLLAANQDSDNVVIFKINKQTGLLTSTGEEIHVPKPVCLQMVKIKTD
jgi:6-phosphogluconolactonase